MDKQGTQTLLQSSLDALGTLYWQTKIAALKTQINSVHTRISQIQAALNQADIESRTADFTAVCKVFNQDVLPQVAKIQADLEKEAREYLDVRLALQDLEKLELASTFLLLPVASTAESIVL